MTAATDVVVLSSTPDHESSRTSQQIPYNAARLFGLSPGPASPPPLASPSELFRSIQSPTNQPQQVTVKGAKKKATGKQVTYESRLDGNVVEGKPRRGRKKAVNGSQTILGDSGPTALGSRDNAQKKGTKTRTKCTGTENKRGGDKNHTLTGRVVKAKSVQTNPDAKALKSSSLQSLSQRDTTKELDDWGSNRLQLEEATKRRLFWTPPKETGSTRESPKSIPARDFSNFLSGYGFTGTMGSQTNSQTVDGGDGPTKRRRIELMDSRVPSNGRPGELVEKDKAPSEGSLEPTFGKKPKKQPKKATTLTARVTARYAPDYIEDSTDAQGGTINKSSIGKRKSKTKPKSQAPEFIVLSPEAAVKSLEDQDLMFGTCSQLEREDSPTTLSDMQTAINASESCMEPRKLGRGTSSGPTMSRFKAPRDLWSEASRNLDGALTQAEVLDLVDECDISQISPRKDREPRVINGKEPENSATIGRQSHSESEEKISKTKDNSQKQPSHRINNDGGKQQEASPLAAGKRQKMPQYSGLTDAELSKQIATYGFKPVKGRQKMIDLLQKCWNSKHGVNAKSDGDNKQKSSESNSTETGTDGSTDSSNHEPSSKPKNKSQQAVGLANMQTNPPRPRRQGSPSPPSSSSRKTAALSLSSQEAETAPQQKFSLADVEEIEDSEDETLPSPSRLQSRYNPESHMKQTRNQSLPISSMTPSSRAAFDNKPRTRSATTTVILDSCDEDEDNDDNGILPDMAMQITKAVRAQPAMPAFASVDGFSKRLRWQEKILMYDPIVLEDFATWLNTEGLGLVAEDREVGTGFLREWCETKGICCCYK